MEDYNFSDEDLDDIIKSVDHEDDIIDLYDDDDFEFVDEETGEQVEEQTELDDMILNEIMSRAERLRAKQRFIQKSAKRSQKLKLALKKHSDTKTLLKRARHLAIKKLKEKMMKKPLSQFSIAEKERAEKSLAKRKAVIDRLTMKLVPRMREIEKKRLSKQTNK